jgi:long-chain acyl-CoA synthetase
MEPIWLGQYPPGIPADIDIHEFASLTDVLLASCRRFDDRPAYSNMGASMTYAAGTSRPGCSSRWGCAMAMRWR